MYACAYAFAYAYAYVYRYAYEATDWAIVFQSFATPYSLTIPPITTIK